MTNCWTDIQLHTHNHSAPLQLGFCGYCAHSYCARKSIFIWKTNNKRLCVPAEQGPMQRVRLRVRLFKRIFNALLCRIPHNSQLSSCAGCVEWAKGGWFPVLVLALSLGATTTCCCCHCRHLFLINFNCFHFFTAYVSVSPHQCPAVIAKKFFNFNEKSAENKSNLKPSRHFNTIAFL